MLFIYGYVYNKVSRKGKKKVIPRDTGLEGKTAHVQKLPACHCP